MGPAFWVMPSINCRAAVQPGAGHGRGGREHEDVIAAAALGLGQIRLELQGEEQIALDRLIGQHAARGEAVCHFERRGVGLGGRGRMDNLRGDNGVDPAPGDGLPQRVRRHDCRSGKQDEERHEPT